MKKTILIWGLALLLTAAAVYVVTNNFTRKFNSQPQPPTSAIEDSNNTVDTVQAPDFTLTDLNGNPVSLADFRGKNIYLNFWATWCPPCRSEMPDMEKVFAKYKDKELVVLAVNLGENRETVKNFMDSNGYHFNVLLDEPQRVAAAYQINSIPTSYFIDKEGNIISKRIGALTFAEMKNHIEKLEEAATKAD